MVTYITAQYRHVVACSGLYPVRSQSLHGGYSSGCIESAMQPGCIESAMQPGCIESEMQPSSTEKSSRTTLHYVILNDSVRDLVLPPWLIPSHAETHQVCSILYRRLYRNITSTGINGDGRLLTHSANGTY